MVRRAHTRRPGEQGRAERERDENAGRRPATDGGRRFGEGATGRLVLGDARQELDETTDTFRRGPPGQGGVVPVRVHAGHALVHRVAVQQAQVRENRRRQVEPVQDPSGHGRLHRQTGVLRPGRRPLFARQSHDQRAVRVARPRPGRQEERVRGVSVQPERPVQRTVGGRLRVHQRRRHRRTGENRQLRQTDNDRRTGAVGKPSRDHDDQQLGPVRVHNVHEQEPGVLDENP